MDDTIRVALRVRPLSDNEIARGCQSCVDQVPNEPQVIVRSTDKSFTYNYVFGPDSSQALVYDTAVHSLVRQLFKGYNVTILAYGQTGSGKTFSMGTCYNGDGEMGIIPRAINDIFSTIAKSTDMEFKVTTSFMELYKEQLYDLLSSSKPRDECVIDIREDSKGICIPGLTEIEVGSSVETLKSLMIGSSGRATGATNMNAQSSRSHAIFTLTIHMSQKSNGGGDTVAKFHLVDLAGSERPKKTGATGERFKEGVNINRGLLALGNVISALGDGQLKTHVPYRDSKLTRLLQDSLGGNSMTLMVACVSPADYNCEETLSTLRYADRARRIKNKPIVNQDPKAAEILRLRKEVTELRLQLIGTGNGEQGICPNHQVALEEEIAVLKAKNRKLTDTLNSALCESTNLMERALLAEVARDRLSIKLAELNARCNEVLIKFDQSNDMSPDSVLKDLQSKIAEVQAEQQRGEEEIKKHELSVFKTSQGSDASSGVSSGYLTPSSSPETPHSLAELDDQEEKHTLQQAELNNELQKLTRDLAIKEELASKLAANSVSLSSLNPEYKTNMKQLEDKICSLESERDTLVQQLQSVQSNKASNKLAEQRRKRLNELESEMAELKKKLRGQANIIKLKEKGDEKILVLNNEIRSMKATKVRLIRQMRQENEQFRAWKLEREKELNRLRDQDRKRQNIMTRMESIHSKQQNVLKRKVEEAAAVNKRLKEALLLQKQCQERRQPTQGKLERVQSWLAQELEVAESTIAAVRIRGKLVEDRALISRQLADLEKTVNDAHSPESSKLNAQISKLKRDIELRSAQIADINQKVLDSDQDNKARTRWDSIQSMTDAKCALKYLFDVVVDVKREATGKESIIEQLEETLKKAEVDILIAEEKWKQAEIQHKNEILAMEKDSAEKLALLLRPLQGAESGSGVCPALNNAEISERMHLLEEENKRLLSASEELDLLKEKYTILEEYIAKEKAAAGYNAPFKTPKPMTQVKKAKPVPQTPDIFSDENDDSMMDDDDENDPDWQKTPLFKRLQKLKRKTSSSSDDSAFFVKKISDGTVSCNCSKGICARCVCQRTHFTCGENCKCDSTKCVNRAKDGESSDSSSPNTSSGAKRASQSQKGILPELPSSFLNPISRENVQRSSQALNKQLKSQSFDKLPSLSCNFVSHNPQVAYPCDMCQKLKNVTSNSHNCHYYNQ